MLDPAFMNLNVERHLYHLLDICSSCDIPRCEFRNHDASDDELDSVCFREDFSILFRFQRESY